MCFQNMKQSLPVFHGSLGLGVGGQGEPTKVSLYCIPIIHQHVNKEVAAPK